MNENIDLTKILKDCPEGETFYTTVWGELKPFDKVLVRDRSCDTWTCCFFSHIINTCDASLKFRTVNSRYNCCIPYNEETKHLVGTTDEASEYYRYWEDEL